MEKKQKETLGLSALGSSYRFSMVDINTAEQLKVLL